ncbi:guanine nucleotide-binding protein G(I)/G(S)/G(O) subunit gamma-10 isoform X1 [Cervus canadensis]|uniref:guanine nucleotide-binding protein G(I)/G(S)/G(O) subunit gamma-10 isoform X1 n=1 Tax=Cervus canadensis TaxID=1574408 RepID=UPI001CA3403B|nr:guanine nucleotide-binding protein G(I)/G(S)/G(O) subunit gamma-10 isoform X1 [Cervus canadensis]
MAVRREARESQGLSGGCRASTILHAECLQGCPAGGCPSWKQPLSGAQILCLTLKTGGAVVKNPSANAGDAVSIPDLGRPPGVGNGNRSNVLAWKIP